MKNLIRTIFAGAGRDRDVWPVWLMLFAVLAPAGSVLWFMSEAMRNERLAVRQKLTDVYRGELVFSQTRLERFWTEKVAGLENLAKTRSAALVFAKGVRSGVADGLIVLDETGRVMYPNTPFGTESRSGEFESKWREARQQEFAFKDFLAAAAVYAALADELADPSAAARALQAEARCLVEAGEAEAAIRLVSETLADERYSQAADVQGRLIVANAELMVLELISDPAAPAFQSTARRLKRRLTDYENPALAAPQRRFLMKELQRLSGESLVRSTLAGEELAARFCEGQPVSAQDSGLRRSSLPDVWQFSTPDHRVIALLRSETLIRELQAKATDHLPPDARVTLVPPGAENPAAFVSLPAGPQFPGWQLALTLKDQKFFDTASGHFTVVYLWTGTLVVAAMAVATLLAARLLRRQVALARLKNDLAATVSHELKTPLASMRVLVDTLLDSETLNEQTVREYLQLIARENERLSRLIQNFLAFSRMERKQYNFHFSVVPVRQILDAALEAVRERFDTPGCRLDVEIEPALPDLLGDADALATALINLLDNAYKYSEDIKHVVLSARAAGGRVIFSVKDNGIGIPPREAKRIFQPFYQVDQRLARKAGGCGLGLGIVHFIATAHRGRVSVESLPGCGSTFALSLPAAASTAGLRQEAVA